MKKLEISESKISSVLKFFKEISAIPRKSGEEKKISEYLINFAKVRELEYYTDEYFNVIIRKKVNESDEYLGLQAHTDMICEKLPNIEHDFSKDGIELYQDGDFITANGTTLGADDGIGIAFILAILDSNQKYKNIEGIFTVQEETTMIGAMKIDVSKIKTKKIIGLDNGKDDKMIISSANCLEWFDLLEIKKQKVNEIEETQKVEKLEIIQEHGKIIEEREKIIEERDRIVYDKLESDLKLYELSYSNFKGGHSGADITDVKRGNPIKLGFDILKNIENVRIQSVDGGSKVNVIPRDFCVRFFAPLGIEEIVNAKIAEQKNFFGDIDFETGIEKTSFDKIEIENSKIEDTEIKKLDIEKVDIGKVKVENVNTFEEEYIKDFKIEFNRVNEFEEENQVAYTVEDSAKIIKYVNSFKNGALNFDYNGNSILSANFGAIREEENGVKFECSIRSNNMNLRDLYVQELVELEEKLGTKKVWEQELKGFEADGKNELADKCGELYENLFGEPIDKTVVQGVIEGGFFKDRIPNLDYICIGAKNIDAHSPNERVSISSIEKIWIFLMQILTI